MTLISILIPVYNGQRFIDRCLGSIARQTFQDYEVIIVDDGSTDDTLTTLRRWHEQDDRIRVFPREHQGIVGALNHGLDQCTGRYIARMDIDDEMLPHRLESQYRYMEDHPEYDIIGGTALIGKNHKWFYVPMDATLRHSLHRPQVFHPTIMMCASSLDRTGLRYIPGTDDYEDTILFIEALRGGLRIRNTGIPANIYYENPCSVTHTKHDILSRQMTYIKEHYGDLLESTRKS